MAFQDQLKKAVRSTELQYTDKRSLKQGDWIGVICDNHMFPFQQGLFITLEKNSKMPVILTRRSQIITASQAQVLKCEDGELWRTAKTFKRKNINKLKALSDKYGK